MVQIIDIVIKVPRTIGNTNTAAEYSYSMFDAETEHTHEWKIQLRDALCRPLFGSFFEQT